MAGVPRLDIVIVNWNTGDALRECVASIAPARSETFAIDRIVVVDNASTDGSADRLDLAAGALRVIRNQANRGFGAACNQGALGTDADFLLFLNPDTRLFRDSLARPLAFMSDPANADVGICGIRLVDDAGASVTSSARFPTLRIFLGEMTGLSRLLPSIFLPHLLKASECAQSRDVDQVIGAYFLIRAALFRAARRVRRALLRVFRGGGPVAARTSRREPIPIPRRCDRVPPGRPVE